MGLILLQSSIPPVRKNTFSLFFNNFSILTDDEPQGPLPQLAQLGRREAPNLIIMCEKKSVSIH